MKRIIFISFFALVALYLFWCYVVWYSFDDLSSLPRVFIFVILPPLFAGTFLRIIFRNNPNPFKLQWITFVLIIVGFVMQSSVLYVSIYDGAHNYSAQWDREQRRIEHVVENWIKNNAAFPETYSKISFSSFIQKTDPFNDKGYSFRPIRYYYLSNDSNDIRAVKKFKVAYYSITHKYALKNILGNIDTTTTFFLLTPMLNIDQAKNLDPKWINWKSCYGNGSNQ